jgi:hypothetical protein
LVGKPEGMRLLGRSRHRCDSIKIYLKEIVQQDTDWCNLAVDRDRDMWLTIMNLQIL